MLCSGEIDRDALGDTVFSNPAARRRLNAATHLPVAIALVGKIIAAWLTCTPTVVRDSQCSRNVSRTFSEGHQRLSRVWGAGD